MLIQKLAKLKRPSMQQAWTEKISLAFRTKISIFSGFKEQLALARTCHYYKMNRNREGVHLTITVPNVFHARSQTKNKVQGIFSPNLLLLLPMSLQLLYRIRSSMKHWLKKRRSTARRWNWYFNRANNLIDVLGIKGKIVNSQCDRVKQKFWNKNLLNQNFSWHSAELTKFLSPRCDRPLIQTFYKVIQPC